MVRRNQALSKQNINGVYIPSALLIIGVGIVKKEWLPFAAIFVALVGGYKFYASRMSTCDLFLDLR